MSSAEVYLKRQLYKHYARTEAIAILVTARVFYKSPSLFITWRDVTMDRLDMTNWRRGIISARMHGLQSGRDKPCCLCCEFDIWFQKLSFYAFKRRYSVNGKYPSHHNPK